MTDEAIPIRGGKRGEADPEQLVGSVKRSIKAHPIILICIPSESCYLAVGVR